MRKKRRRKVHPHELVGIPIVLSFLLVLYFVIYYRPEFGNDEYDKIVYKSDRYRSSSRPGWHLIDFGYFTIETPDDYHYFLERGIHGGKVGGLSNGNDTINFAFGIYYFDACESVISGQVVGTCDTLDIFDSSGKEIVFVKTDNDCCAFVARDEGGNTLKLSARLAYDNQLIREIYRTIKTK